ncbi:hypothetical protein JZ751_019306 [Albula glossodonta]|uniref:Uncharacterized protein n=1 Tax=Albula glossodonta TaxID=121402 RepID=A0A8T2MUQ8_9TELE|nr:hypothetical protein JZ751_019306 [Albula glossodonta]
MGSDLGLSHRLINANSLPFCTTWQFCAGSAVASSSRSSSERTHPSHSSSCMCGWTPVLWELGGHGLCSTVREAGTTLPAVGATVTLSCPGSIICIFKVGKALPLAAVSMLASMLPVPVGSMVLALAPPGSSSLSWLWWAGRDRCPALAHALESCFCRLSAEGMNLLCRTLRTMSGLTENPSASRPTDHSSGDSCLRNLGDRGGPALAQPINMHHTKHHYLPCMLEKVPKHGRPERSGEETGQRGEEAGRRGEERRGRPERSGEQRQSREERSGKEAGQRGEEADRRGEERRGRPERSGEEAGQRGAERRQAGEERSGEEAGQRGEERSRGRPERRCPARLSIHSH